MALIYKNPNNIPFSGWIVSGKEAEIIIDALKNPKPLNFDMERLRKIMAVTA